MICVPKLLAKQIMTRVRVEAALLWQHSLLLEGVSSLAICDCRVLVSQDVRVLLSLLRLGGVLS